jgi:putative transposase
MYIPVNLSLKFATKAKIRKLDAVYCRWLTVVDKYIGAVWERQQNGGCDKYSMEVYHQVPKGRLTSLYQMSAYREAWNLVNRGIKSSDALKTKTSRPTFRGPMTLKDKAVRIVSKPGSSFDYWLYFPTLRKRTPVRVPVKGTKILKKWLSKPGAVLRPGVVLDLKRMRVTFWVCIPDLPVKDEGKVIGLDTGMKKLLVDSDGKKYGTEMMKLCKIASARVQGSGGRRRARTAIENYINRTIQSLPWTELKGVVIEDIKNLKRGKKRRESRKFRRTRAPWRYAYVLNRIQHKAAENRVFCCRVYPAYTSQICPSCSHRARENRVGEVFKCVRCGYASDADHVGAVNILARFRGELEVPQLGVIN